MPSLTPISANLVSEHYSHLGTCSDTGCTTPVSTVGSAVAGWADQSGNGNHFTQSTAAQKPLISATQFNSHPALDFDVSKPTNMLVPDVSVDNQAETWYAVFRSTKGCQPGGIVGNGGSYDLFYGTNAVMPQILAGSFVLTPNQTDSYGIQVDGNILAVAQGPSDTQFVMNGVAIPGTACTAGVATGLQVGLFPGAYGMNGQLCALLRYSATHSSGNRNTIIAFLQTLYSLRSVIDVPTSSDLVAIDGDSQACGTLSTSNATKWDDAGFANALPAASFVLRNYSIAGAATSDCVARQSNLNAIYSASRRRNILFYNVSTNNFSNPGTYTDLKNLCQTMTTAGWEVILFGCFPRQGRTQSDVDAVNALLRADFGSSTPYTNILKGAAWAKRFIDIASDSHFTAYDPTYEGDGVHISDAGQTIQGSYTTDALLSVTNLVIAGGASSGVAGAASPAFTVTRDIGQYTGSETVTLTASNGTITATAAGGSISGNGTGAVIVTPVSTATAFTFTYTPASAGNRTISYTNAQGWDNPADTAYTATATATAGGSKRIFVGVGFGF
jgi:hypothetical protein